MKRSSLLIPLAILLGWLSAAGYTLVAVSALGAEPTDNLPTLVAPVVTIDGSAQPS